MRQRLAALVSVLTLALGAFGAAPPAGSNEACAGQGIAVTGAPLTYPVTATSAPQVTVRQPRIATWGFSTTLGTCAPDLAKALSATGLVSGWCGLSSGTGTTGNGIRFAWVGVGGVLAFTGGLVGVAQVTPNALANQSCHTGATSFLVAFATAKVGCGTTKSKGLVDSPVPVPPYLGPLPGDVVWVHSDGSPHVWYKLCLGVK